ncbi:hypothetical protein [Devosia sp.]|uniref:hypothetical protein n=1 Tax=Devosia sp. TaxID=1871048 RepID=UPI003F6EF27A
MSASPFPWNVLGLTRNATEKEVRRAYATKLKLLDTAKDPEQFQELRGAYELALMLAQVAEAGNVEGADDKGIEQDASVSSDDGIDDFVEHQSRPALAPPKQTTVPFETMHTLVAERNYSVGEWQRLLNDPLLDDPGAGAAFESALVSALSENELKAESTLSAGKAWRDLIESRYAWVEDGIRYTRKFPFHSDLRQVLVELGQSSRPLPYSPVRETNQFAGLGKVVLVLLLLGALIQLLNKMAT